MAEINGHDVVDAWRNAVRHVCEAGAECQNLLVTVDNPDHFAPSWLNDFSPHRLIPGSDNINDVIATVFPYKLANRCTTRAELYHRYLSAHDRARHYVRNRGAWGTYFERLIRLGPASTNQLETVIQKLGSWNVRATAALVFHPSSPVFDSPRKRGGPCWHFGELLWHASGTLDLVAVYRNHDYFNKALGNFISLGQLLAFICRETGKRPGKLVCHSVHAFYDIADRDVIRFARI